MLERRFLKREETMDSNPELTPKCAIPDYVALLRAIDQKPRGSDSCGHPAAVVRARRKPYDRKFRSNGRLPASPPRNRWRRKTAEQMSGDNAEFKSKRPRAWWPKLPPR